MKNRTVLINNLYPTLNLQEEDIHKLFLCLDSLENFQVPPGELSIAFLDDNTLASLHDQFLDDPTTTDVMTFPGDPPNDFAGEICVSVDTALSAAETHNSPFHKELTLYLVHGFLHLSGLNDLTEKEKKVMRHAEFESLQALEKAGAIPHFSIS